MAVGDRVGDYRRRMREMGYRPVQVWVRDVRTEEFAREAERQSALLAASDRHSDDMDYVEAISVLWDEP